MSITRRTDELLASGMPLSAAIAQAATEMTHPTQSYTYSTNSDGSVKITGGN